MEEQLVELLVVFSFFFSSARLFQYSSKNQRDKKIKIKIKINPYFLFFAQEICVCASVCVLYVGKMKRRSLMLGQRPRSWCSATSGGR
jgi:hypothetical protein